MEKKVFPQLPSDLELAILSFKHYCPVCTVHNEEEHHIELCFNCEKMICYNFDNNIWKLNNKEICFTCRLELIKQPKNVTFVKI